jgi:hypothetical protein
MTSLEIDPHYILFKSIISENIIASEKASQSIQKFRQLLIDHLAPGHTIVELENTPIHLEDLDDELVPLVQEYLTNYYAYKQQSSQLFLEISQIFYKLHSKHPEISLTDFKNLFESQKLPIYITPVKSDKLKNCQFIWNKEVKDYQLFLTVTSSEEHLNKQITNYGYTSIEDSYKHLGQCGFATLIDNENICCETISPAT